MEDKTWLWFSSNWYFLYEENLLELHWKVELNKCDVYSSGATWDLHLHKHMSDGEMSLPFSRPDSLYSMICNDLPIYCTVKAHMLLLCTTERLAQELQSSHKSYLKYYIPVISRCVLAVLRGCVSMQQSSQACWHYIKGQTGCKLTWGSLAKQRRSKLSCRIN